MGEHRKNVNERRLEQLRSLRHDVIDEPSLHELVERQAARIAELEAEVDRLRDLLRATRPAHDASPSRSSQTSPGQRPDQTSMA